MLQIGDVFTTFDENQIEIVDIHSDIVYFRINNGITQGIMQNQFSNKFLKGAKQC